MSTDRQVTKPPMDLADAIAINALLGALGETDIADDGAEAALQLAARSFSALKVGTMPDDLVLGLRGPGIRVIRLIDARNICSCGYEAIEDVSRCESCGRDLAFSTAVPAIPERGRLRCSECGSHDFVLYVGDGAACAMVRNTEHELTFERDATLPRERPLYMDVDVPTGERPSICCAGACERAIVVPARTYVTYGDAVSAASHERDASATKAPASDLPDVEDRGEAPEYPWIAEATVDGAPFAFLTVGPYEGSARQRADRTLQALGSFVEDREIRRGDSPLGERVQLLRDVDRYSFVAPAGATGTVTECGKHLCAVTLDEPVPGMGEWDGEVHFTIEDAVAHHLEPRSAVMAMWEACEPLPAREAVSAAAAEQPTNALRRLWARLHRVCEPCEADPSLATMVRDRSYRVRRTVPVGTRVRAIDAFDYDGAYPAGTEGRLEWYGTAGDEGVLAVVRLDDGTYVQLSAGNLAPVRPPAT